MKWIEVPVPLGGKTEIAPAKWFWHIVDGQRQEIRRLAAADAVTEPMQVQLTGLYGEIVAGLVDDHGLKMRDLFLAESFTVKLINGWADATGRDLYMWVEPERTTTFAYLEDEHAQAFSRWQKKARAQDTGGTGECGRLALAIIGSLRTAGVFDFALWKAVDRIAFEAKAKTIRRQIDLR